MRKAIQILSVLVLVLLAACSTDANSNAEETAENKDKEVATEEDAKQTEGNEVEEDKDEKNEEAKEDEPVVEEEVVKKYKLNTAFWGFEPINDAPSEAVLLTIDDAPDKHALDMAKTLKELEAPAIFFVNGHFMDTEEEKAIVKEIHEMGFEIGNHTMSHADLKSLSEEKQREEIVKLSDMIEEVIGERPTFFRAPFGSNTDFSKALVKEEGMLLMNWTYGYDWNKEYQNKEGITDIMVNTPLLQDGANLLMHDREWTAAGLADIVKGLRDKGYSMIDPETIDIELN
ncbi:polysaccharide deacetylase family protein [Alkalihalobacillus sp. CinArs1]|uniref:polysaccharide deacetylase family protein n=1 Tax=Alkalihalobacillus sp. CinArs1 TaxID=2995314 RepID=UPI0022DD4420|nr:polysaccharide deacetylase family protein [Alkalihalobacillus sp. CinArs1]